MATYNLNDCFIDQFGQIWFVKELPNAKGYYLMGEAYNCKPDRLLSVSGLEDMLKNGMLKFGWTAKDAKRWKK